MTQKKKQTKPAAKKKPTEIKEYQRKEVLMKLYPSESAGSIARKFDVSRAAVLNQLRKHEIKITTRTSPKTGPGHFKKDVDRSFHDKKFLIEKMKNGLGVSKIAALCGTTHGQVLHFIKKHDLMPMVEEMRAKAKAKPVKKTTKKGDLAKVEKTIKKHEK